MKVVATELPRESELNRRVGATDFLDCYAVDSPLSPRRAAGIVVDFPVWVCLLLWLRKVVTAVFGLSSNGPPAQGKLGLFPVEMETAQELIAGFDDRHLDFRISVQSREGRVFLATWVHPHTPVAVFISAASCRFIS